MAKHHVKEYMSDNDVSKILEFYSNAEMKAKSIVEQIKKSDELCDAISTQLRTLYQNINGEQPEKFAQGIATNLVSCHFDFGRNDFTKDLIYNPIAMELIELNTQSFLPKTPWSLMHELKKAGFIDFQFIDNVLTVQDLRDNEITGYISYGDPTTYPNEENNSQARIFFKYSYCGPTLLQWLYVRQKTIEKCSFPKWDEASMLAVSKLKELSFEIVPMINALHQRLASILLKLLKYNACPIYGDTHIKGRTRTVSIYGAISTVSVNDTKDQIYIATQLQLNGYIIIDDSSTSTNRNVDIC